VASKPFGESFLLAEMFAQLLEARHFPVDRRLGLGATEIAFRALRTNAIDVYPEYTGTGLLAILGERPSPDPRQVFSQVAREFRERYGVRWLPPLGFQNTYAIAVRRETARRLRLATLSDLARESQTLRAGLTPDFIGRADGLPGLGKAYGLRFGSVRALLPAVKYQALAAGDVDVIDGYSTDGFIVRYDLVVLEDDRRFFPPYEAAALLSPGLQRDSPAAVAALTELSGLLTEVDMRRLNRRIEVDGIPVSRVAAAALLNLGLTPAGTVLISGVSGAPF
jgi:glycine betaine/choline ABC-type transport system substrate-binding protein